MSNLSPKVGSPDRPMISAMASRSVHRLGKTLFSRPLRRIQSSSKPAKMRWMSRTLYLFRMSENFLTSMTCSVSADKSLRNCSISDYCCFICSRKNSMSVLSINTNITLSLYFFTENHRSSSGRSRERPLRSDALALNSAALRMSSVSCRPPLRALGRWSWRTSASSSR